MKKWSMMIGAGLLLSALASGSVAISSSKAQIAYSLLDPCEVHGHPAGA